MTIPQEVQRATAFIEELSEIGKWGRERVQKYIPSFILDVWIIGTKSDSS